MGLYYRFETKVINLKRNTPKEVINFLDQAVNKKDFIQFKNYIPFDHELFHLPRWRAIFSTSAFLEKPPHFSPLIDGSRFNQTYHRLYLNCEINYGYAEIQAFVNWIKPYVAGRKKKEYIGWWNNEDQTDWDKQNLYIERDATNK